MRLCRSSDLKGVFPDSDSSDVDANPASNALSPLHHRLDSHESEDEMRAEDGLRLADGWPSAFILLDP